MNHQFSKINDLFREIRAEKGLGYFEKGEEPADPYHR